jgi:hypothetical protein
VGQLYVTAKKEKQRQTGLAKKDGGARVSSGNQVITDGYAIGPECLACAGRTGVERERKEVQKATSGVLARESLKDKVEHFLQKGPDPQAGKWNNHDLKVTIQWYKRDGGSPMPKNKEGLFLRYRKTCGRVMPGYYIQFTLAASTYIPTASASCSRVHKNTINLNLNPKKIAAAILAPIPRAQAPDAQALEPATAPIVGTILVAAADLVPTVALHCLAS